MRVKKMERSCNSVILQRKDTRNTIVHEPKGLNISAIIKHLIPFMRKNKGSDITI